MNFAPLHNHSEYSALDGLSTCLEIAQRCLDIGCPCCAITDHGTVAGHLEFDKVMRKHDIKPIFGCELYHGVKTEFEKNERDQSHFVAGALTSEGLRNLWRLVDAASTNFRYVGRVNWEMLEKYNEGLFATSACLQGLIPKGIQNDDFTALNRYLDIFGDRFYIELHCYPTPDQEEMNKWLVDVAQERGVPVVYATDAHFACNPAETPIWMGDGSFKSLGMVTVGDEVVGWHREDGAAKSTLTRAKVLAVHEYHDAPIVKVTFASGRTLRCTPNHLWKTASYGGGKPEHFAEPNVGRKLVHVVEPSARGLDGHTQWLAGLFDGEGCISKNRITFYQSLKRMDVIERIEQTLDRLAFKYSVTDRDGYGKYVDNPVRVYSILGGRSERVRFLNVCNPARRPDFGPEFLSSQWQTADEIVAIEPDGTGTVYGLTTTTSNYVAWGYASKNSPDQYPIHDAYLVMQTGQKKGETIFTDPEDRSMWHPRALYIKDEQEIRESLSYLPERIVDEALSNSWSIADMANAELPGVERHLATFVPKACPWIDREKAPEVAASMLINLVEEGIVERYGEDAPEEVWERAEREMDVFLEAGLEHYFLQAWDFCKFCDENAIQRGPGRGSAAGSLVAYALRITDVDPLHYDLIFERFYNPGRAKGFPDIDNDFPKKDRKRVREYLMNRWGGDNVRTIGTIMRMKPKAVLDKTYKVCGVTWDEKEGIKKLVDQVPDIDILGPDSIGWSADVDPGKTIYVMHSTPQSEHDVGEQILRWLQDHPEDRQDILLGWLDIVAVLCSRISGYGVHPSGVVVSDVGLPDELPCMWNANQKVQVTCFPMDDVDGRMFVKQDLLGLRNLDILHDWEDQVRGVGIEINWSGLERQPVDEEMWELLDNGLSLGIFQIEKGYARQLCKEFRPRSVEDLSIIVALNRPGPIRSGAPDSFITRRNGGEDDQFDGRKVPILADILEPTYGWFLYQEQVIAYFSKLGYNLSDADAVRKILGKKKPEEMQALKNGEGEWEGKGYFVMAKRAGLEDDLAHVIWDKLEDFAKYSFNKSHSVAYAVIGFRTLFAKYHAPAEFIMACIRTSEDREKIGEYVSEGRRMGIQIAPPDILYSKTEIGVHDRTIYFGLADIKGVGRGAADFLVGLRERHDLSTPDLLADAMDLEQEQWESERDAAKAEGRPFKKKSPRQQFNAKHEQLLYSAGCYDNYGERDDIKLAQKQKLEKELLGVILTDDCEQIFINNADLLDACDDWDLIREDESAKVKVPGVIANITPKRTKKDGKAMGIISVEYQGDEIEAVVFPQLWGNYKFLWKERTPAIFTFKRNERGWQFEEGIRLS